MATNLNDRAERDREVRRARDAAAILESPIFLESWNALIRSYESEWQNTYDTDKRESLWYAQRAARKFLANLEYEIQTGKLAAEQLAEMDSVRRPRT